MMVDSSPGASPEAPRRSARLVLIGPPGAGKGTLAENLCSFSFDHISSGDIFRGHVRNQTPLGQRLGKSLANGQLVSDELTLETMKKWFWSRKPSQGFLLDGFPRTLSQAQAFDEWLESRSIKLDAVIHLHLQEEAVVKRIAYRRVCPKDGRVYHLLYNPPAREGICDDCGTELIQRPDDREPVIRERLRIYRQKTEPVLTYYREQGLLLTIHSEGHAADLAKTVEQKLQPFFAIR
ncbi:MAG: nucleoside monophosphate kinase [Opitutales bacterium]|nr:nucleoside monophosphate kinase [Opitutales bacterium]MCH8539876.1 nucleoside monophosphate kinase [Opitutales bacterium]